MEDDFDEGLGCFRGLLIALPIGLLFWIAIGWGIWLAVQ